MCFTERLFYNSKQNSFSLNPSKSKFKSSLYKSNSNNPNVYHNKKENSFNFGEYKDKASLLKRIHIRTESMPIQEEIFQNERALKNQSKSKGVSNIKHTNSIKDNKLAQILAASGFRDTTRLALSNLEMANDMVNMNTGNIKEAYIDFRNSFENLINGDYTKLAEDIKRFRNDLYN